MHICGDQCVVQVSMGESKRVLLNKDADRAPFCIPSPSMCC